LFDKTRRIIFNTKQGGLNEKNAEATADTDSTGGSDSTEQAGSTEDVMLVLPVKL
jgi:hypothetical protein